MKKCLILLLILCFTLVGCNQKENDVKGEYDLMGIITEVDIEGNRILAKEVDKEPIWIALQKNGNINNYNVGQEIVVWIDGGIDTSTPAYAKALNIEILGEGVTNGNEAVQPSLPEFNFKQDEFPPAITGYVKINETRYKMTKGNFEWKKGNETVQTDALSPSQIAENFKPIIAEPNSKATIEIEQNANLSVYLWDSEEVKLAFKGNQISVPSIKGRYIYEVVAKWSNGETSFTFVVDIK